MKLSTRQKKVLSLNITSLIDVLFILLLFFVVTSTFKDPASSALDLDLPKSKETKKKNIPEEETLFINKKKQISLAGAVFPLDSFQILFPKIKEKIKSKTIVLKGDKEVSYQSLITILDILKGNEIDKIVLASDNEDKN